MRKLIAVSLACLGLNAVAAAAEIYRWVDSKGVVHYSDKPLAPSDKPAELPHLQTYSHSAVPTLAPAAPASAAPPPAASHSGLSITAPVQDETIRDPEGKFTVTVSASPKDGQGLVYYLDGAAENQESTLSTAFLYARVERGEHTVAVALVDADGHELERTAAVTVHLMPPTVKKH